MKYIFRENNEVNKQEVKDKLAKFANSKSISSDDYYGISKKKSEEEYEGKSGLDKAKDIGATIYESAKNKAQGGKQAPRR